MQNHYCYVTRVSRVITFALLFTYLSAVLGALTPLVYYFANQDYIAENLCENRASVIQDCNGKCYLNNQLSETAENQNQEVSTSLEKCPELLSFPIPELQTQLFSDVNSFPNVLNLYALCQIHDVFHPPSYL